MNLSQRLGIISSLCLGFLIGCLIAESLPWLKIWPTLLVGFLASLYLVWPKPLWRVLIFCLIGLMLGVMRWDSALRTWNTSPPMRVDVQIHGWLRTPLQTTNQGSRAVVQVSEMRRENIKVHLTATTSLTTTFPRETNLKYGDEIYFQSKLSYLPRFGSFDGQRYWRLKGVQAQTIVKQFQKTDRNSGNKVVKSIYNLRDYIQIRVLKVLPGDEGKLLLGLLFGGSGLLSKDVADQFRTLGISHLTAVSGYNLTIISLWPVALAGLIHKRLAIFFAIVLVIIFVIFTAAPSSIVRAAIMALVVLVGKIIGRPPHTLLLIILTATLMAVINPFVVKDDAGFALSFLAFFGLIELAPLLTKYVKWLMVKPLIMIASETFGAELATLPYLLGAFGQLSIYAFLANLVILPLIPLIMLVGLVVVLLNLIPASLFSVWLGLLYFPLHSLLWSVEQASHLPFASIAWPRGGIFAYYLAVLIFVWWLVATRRRKKIIVIQSKL